MNIHPLCIFQSAVSMVNNECFCWSFNCLSQICNVLGKNNILHMTAIRVVNVQRWWPSTRQQETSISCHRQLPWPSNITHILDQFWYVVFPCYLPYAMLNVVTGIQASADWTEYNIIKNRTIACYDTLVCWTPLWIGQEDVYPRVAITYHVNFIFKMCNSDNIGASCGQSC